MQRRNAERLRQWIGGLVEAEMRWPWPDGFRPTDRLFVALLSGMTFFVAFHGLFHLSAVFAAGSLSLFFPIAGLCFLFGFLLGPVYLPVPVLAVLLGEIVLGRSVDSETLLNIIRQAMLYGGAGVLLRIHRGRMPAATVSRQFGGFLVTTIAAVSVNLPVALAVFAWTGASSAAPISTTALVFLLGDLSGLLLLVPPALLLADVLLERRRARRETIRLGRRDRLVAGGLFALAACFVLLAVVVVDDDIGITAAMTPALLPILIGAVLFGYTTGLGLFSLAAALLLTISAVVADAPSALALQTVLIVCCIATLSVGAATSDRMRLIAGLDDSMAERARQLDAANAVLTRSNAELRAVAATDHLTGLANRRAFEAALRQRLGRSGPGPRSGAALGADVVPTPESTTGPAASAGLLILDIDRFKRINDTHGHAAGDQALVHVARLLEAGLRDGDLLARIGGEEFAVLSTAADADQLREVAERLRRMVRNAPLQPVGNAGPLAISVSVGGAMAGPGDDMDRLLRSADRALYAAKRAGRNRSRIAHPPEAEPTAALSA